MKSLCKGFCEILKPTGYNPPNNQCGRGQKFCSWCAKFVVCDKVRCPCRNGPLRIKSRKSSPRQKMEKEMNAY